MRSRLTLFGLGLLLAVGVSVPSVAHAQRDMKREYPVCTKDPTAGSAQEAHNKYIEGKGQYDASDFEPAIRNFNLAYSLDCTKTELLVIISRAYENLHYYRESIDVLRLYLERADKQLSVAEKDTYDKRIKRMEGELAKTAPPPPTGTTTAPPPSGTSSPPPPKQPKERLSPIPFVIGGIGVATLTTGIILFALAPAFPDQCNKDTNKCTPRPGTSDSVDDLSSQATRSRNLTTGGAITAVAGGLVLATGVVWFFVAGKVEEDAKLHLTPQVAPGYGGLSLTKSF